MSQYQSRENRLWRELKSTFLLCSSQKKILFFSVSCGFGAVKTEFNVNLDMLAQCVKMQLIGNTDKLDLKINNQRFVGWSKPWSRRGDENKNSNYQVNIVFALKSGCDAPTAAAYQTLSNKIGVTLVMLQKQCGFLEREDKLADIVDGQVDPIGDFPKVSFIVQPLIDMYNEVRSKGNIHVRSSVD